MGGTASFCTGVPSIKHAVPEETVLRIQNNSQICVIRHYGQYTQSHIDEIRKLRWVENTCDSYTA